MYSNLCYSKIYENKRAESIAMQQYIFKSERGFSGDLPLIIAIAELATIAYSKGAVAIYKLIELIS